MSGEQFLRAHGWKLGQDLWWHERMGWDVGHDYGVALLQTAQWLAQDLADVRRLVDTYGDDVPEKAIRLIRLTLNMEA